MTKYQKMVNEYAQRSLAGQGTGLGSVHPNKIADALKVSRDRFARDVRARALELREQMMLNRRAQLVAELAELDAAI